MIYRPSGELIGDTKAFIAYVKHAYKLEMDFDKDLQMVEIDMEDWFEILVMSRWIGE